MRGTNLKVMNDISSIIDSFKEHLKSKTYQSRKVVTDLSIAKPISSITFKIPRMDKDKENDT